MLDITIKEIKEAACGTDEAGNAKSIVIIGVQKFDVNDTSKEPETIMEISTIDAIVDIKTIGSFSYINLKFPGSGNSDLSLSYRALERYYDTADSTEDGYETVAFISIIPMELEGQYTINALYPIFWSLEPDIVGDPARSLRIVHLPEDIQFIRTDLNDGEYERLMMQAQENAEISEIEELFRRENADDFESELEERNAAFTDDKYDFSNGSDPFDYSGNDDEDYDEEDEDENE